MNGKQLADEMKAAKLKALIFKMSEITRNNCVVSRNNTLRFFNKVRKGQYLAYWEEYIKEYNS